jgi:hypothetical protein
VNISAEVDVRPVVRALDGLEGLVRHPAPIVARVAPTWLAEVEIEQFGSRGAAGASGPWRTLAPSTLKAKALQGFPSGILDRTGGVRKMMTRVESLRQMMRVGDDGISFSLPRVAALHQRGTRRMPQRKVVDPSRGQAGRFVDRVRAELVAGARGMGWGVQS